MQKYLGIYIEENLIKYAKVSKEKEDLKVEAFGIKFFEGNLSSEIKKVIEETYSFNIPISINLSNEKYLYIDVFALLSKKDIEKTIETEFELYCEENKINKSGYETRFAVVPNDVDKGKLKAINIFINKIELNRQLQQLEGYKVNKIIPTSVAIGNIAKISKKENQLIVNMEEKTTIIKILDKKVHEITTLDVGSKEVLDNINKIENSYSKAYEMCKNTTIYTSDVNVTEEEQPYLQYIVPTLYKIAEKVKEILAEDTTKFQTIYLTGTLASVNNVDLYFQEFMPNVECKLMKPNFIDETTKKINIKDYIEVNSAIALAVAGLGEGVQELNFKKSNGTDKISQMFKIEKRKGPGDKRAKLEFNLFEQLDSTETWLLRGIGAILLIMVIYSVFSFTLSNQMIKKQAEIEAKISKQTEEIFKATEDETRLSKNIEEYIKLISDMKKLSERASDIQSSRNSIPNLLNQIMSAIPRKVQLVSIENTSGKAITIHAQSSDYDQLGYFISVLENENILKNVESSSGIKNDGTVSVTIEGTLP